MCVDYKDLNKACPKDDYPLPIIEILVDYTVWNDLLSFVDGLEGYNQMLMDPEHMTKTALTTPWGDFLLHCHALRPEERWCYLPKGSHYSYA